MKMSDFEYPRWYRQVLTGFYSNPLRVRCLFHGPQGSFPIEAVLRSMGVDVGRDPRDNEEGTRSDLVLFVIPRFNTGKAKVWVQPLLPYRAQRWGMARQTEQVYDEEMAPLVAQLIEIAKRESIPLFVSAGMVMEDGSKGGCTTNIPSDDFPGYTNRLTLCTGIVRGHSGFDTASAMMITRHHPTEDP